MTEHVELRRDDNRLSSGNVPKLLSLVAGLGMTGLREESVTWFLLRKRAKVRLNGMFGVAKFRELMEALLEYTVCAGEGLRGRSCSHVESPSNTSTLTQRRSGKGLRCKGCCGGRDDSGSNSDLEDAWRVVFRRGRVAADPGAREGL